MKMLTPYVDEINHFVKRCDDNLNFMIKYSGNNRQL